MTDCPPGNTAPTFLIRTSILPARRSARTRASAQCAVWISPAVTPSAAKRQPTRWSRGISSAIVGRLCQTPFIPRRFTETPYNFASGPIRFLRPFRADLVQNRLNRRVGLQQRRPHDFAKFATRLPKFLSGSLNDWVHHCLLMRCSEPGAFILGQVRQQTGAALILKLAKRPVRPIRRLSENTRRELRSTRQGGNEEESQFQFHLFGL